MKWRCRGSHWKWTLIFWGAATLWMHTTSGGTILHFILLYRLNVILEVNRIVKVKTLRIRKTQHQHATELEKDLVIFRDSWVSLPLHNSLKLHCYSNGPWSTKTSPWHLALSRVLLIYSHSPYFLPTPGSAASTLTGEKTWQLKTKDISN